MSSDAVTDDDLTSLRYSRRPIWVAFAITVAVFAGVFWLAVGETVVDELLVSRWSQFLKLPPNTMADTLAGLGAILTLVWVVASVFQQSLELRAQREEFRRMAKQQVEQYKISKNQDISLDDMNRRQVFASKIEELRAYLTNIGPHRGAWYIKPISQNISGTWSLGAAKIDIDDRAFMSSQSNSLVLKLVEQGFANFIRDTTNVLSQEYHTIEFPKIQSSLAKLKGKVDDLISIYPENPAKADNNEDLMILKQISRQIDNIIKDDRLWTDSGWVPGS